MKPGMETGRFRKCFWGNNLGATPTRWSRFFLDRAPVFNFKFGYQYKERL
jgi:hypothetical protein